MASSKIMLAIEFVHKGMKSHFAAKLAGVPENVIAEVLEDEAIFLHSIERPEVDLAWIHEISKDEINEIKRVNLLAELKELKKTPNHPGLPALVKKIKIHTGRLQGISPEKIARACEYPLTDLIKSRGGVALCPFHDDKTPSMDVRKNFFYCYGCGANGNAINFVMRTENLTFPQAVEKLS
jgi:hypothetical protein